ncbi:hypothetical protein SKAU_G00064900 [Synaphobranchus kaupii]|uniref:Uncharacterized protein n=1 Tax=Synaphobranchus kaupii TaxID=118154 RepID=A0A9Q1G5Q9_SYNKA|nr:hypothetical protein SKAU_G00064900 [Synaphobranchus kaupii]
MRARGSRGESRYGHGNVSSAVPLPQFPRGLCRQTGRAGSSFFLPAREARRGQSCYVPPSPSPPPPRLHHHHSGLPAVPPLSTPLTVRFYRLWSVLSADPAPVTSSPPLLRSFKELQQRLRQSSCGFKSQTGHPEMRLEASCPFSNEGGFVPRMKARNGRGWRCKRVRTHRPRYVIQQPEDHGVGGEEGNEIIKKEV